MFSPCKNKIKNIYETTTKKYNQLSLSSYFSQPQQLQFHSLKILKETETLDCTNNLQLSPLLGLFSFIFVPYTKNMIKAYDLSPLY